MPILERADYLDCLHEHARHAAAGRGRLVFLGGEAGGGKTALIEQFTDSIRDQAPATIVSCDGLKMPGPFGSLFDVASALGPEVASVLATEAPRDRIFRTVLDALQRTDRANVLVGEDAHWTDEASLELFRFLGRRIGSTHTLFIVTYRDDSLEPYHPLRRVLGDLVNEPSVSRMWLPPLSVEAVATLAEGTGIDPEALHARTGGNPFYVSEIVAGGDASIPDSIRDAVLARATTMSPEGRALIDTAAVLGVVLDPDVLEAVSGAPIADAVDECLAAGVFRPFKDRIAFRHGLTREVFLRTMPVTRRRVLHRKILHVLETTPLFEASLAHLAHHAEEARDAAAVLRYAPPAARRARAFGAHREAAAQFSRTLRFSQTLPPGELTTLLEERSYECYLTGNLDDAIADRTRAVELWTDLGQPVKAGDSLRWLSRFCWFAGDNGAARRHARAARQLLETEPPGPELAMAWSNLSQLHMLSSESSEAIHWGNKAIALARTLDNQAILAHALTNVGTARMMLADPAGRDLLEQSIRIAEEHGLHDDAARAMTNLTWNLVGQCDLAAAEPMLARALEFTAARDLVAMELYLQAIHARVLHMRGNYAQARQQAESVSEVASATSLTRIVALTILAQVIACTGDDPGACIAEATSLAEPTGELQRLGPLAIATAEAAWLAGDDDRVVQAAETAFTRAVDAREPWMAGALALWLHRAGRDIDDVSALAGPYAWEIRGEGARAANFWRGQGCPLDEARALASTGDPDALLEALAITDRIGAKPDSARIVRALRQLGLSAIPRGPRPQTRANPAQLTARELEVLELLVDGHTNRAIADALYLSPRTVGHHVSAILGKLDIPSRADAPARVRELDLFPDRSLATAK